MNAQLKTILLTVATLSLFAIALVELSGVSRTALINKFGSEDSHAALHEEREKMKKEIEGMARTTVEFDETLYQFGKVKEGAVVTHDFRFTNTGEHPLVIFRADASCGCTVPSFPREPIAPGDSGVITVKFDSKGRPGLQKKYVMIHSNAEQEAMSIGFEVEVES